MSVSFDLSGRCALITGANTGIGQGMAVGLAEAGADIVAVGRSDADETGDRVRALGRNFHFIKADLGSTAPLEGVVAEAWDKAGGVDILVNNAGIIRRADSLDFTEEDWDAVMDTNLKVLFFLSQQVARRWVAEGRKGKIINIASMLSFQGGIRVPSYTASKSGVAGPDQADGLRVGVKGHQRQRHRAGLYRHQQHRGPAQRRDPQPRHPRPDPGRRAGAIRPTWRARLCSWRRQRRTTCTAPSCPWTGAGWPAETDLQRRTCAAFGFGVSVVH